MVEQPTTGYAEMARRTGVHYGDDHSRTPTTKECPDGVVFRRTKYLGPFAYPGAFLINVAKHKTHSMGLTLCVKNLQGTNVPPYIRFCGGLNPALAADFQPDAQGHVDALYEKHLKAGLPRWETAKGPWMEMWAQRTIDHYALIQPSVGLHVIEGIYAQNGDGFDGGPGTSGLPEVFMTNVLVFGRDAFRVDIVGHWLGRPRARQLRPVPPRPGAGGHDGPRPEEHPGLRLGGRRPPAHPARPLRPRPARDALPPEAGRGALPLVQRAVRLRPPRRRPRASRAGTGRACARSERPARRTGGGRWPSSTGFPPKGPPASRSTTRSASASACWRRGVWRAACTRARGARSASPPAPIGGASGPMGSTSSGRPLAGLTEDLGDARHRRAAGSNANSVRNG